MTTPRDEQKRQLADLFERKTLEQLSKLRPEGAPPIDAATLGVVRASSEELASQWLAIGDMVDHLIPKGTPKGWLDALLDKALEGPGALPLDALPPHRPTGPCTACGCDFGHISGCVVLRLVGDS